MHCKKTLTKTSHNNNNKLQKNTQNNNLGKEKKKETCNTSKPAFLCKVGERQTYFKKEQERFM